MRKMRLIDANGVIRYLANTRRFDEEDRLFTYDDVKQIIRNAPTIEAEPERHGHWVLHPNAFGLNVYECSDCGHYVNSGADKNYCSNCGAKMDGGAEDATD